MSHGLARVEAVGGVAADDVTVETDRLGVRLDLRVGAAAPLAVCGGLAPRGARGIAGSLAANGRPFPFDPAARPGASLVRSVGVAAGLVERRAGVAADHDAASPDSLGAGLGGGVRRQA